MKKKLVLKIIFGVIVLFLLFYKIGYREIFDTLLRTNLSVILVVLFHIFFQVLFSSANIKILLVALKQKIPYLHIFRLYFTVWAIGKFTPEGIGEFSIIYFLRKRGLCIGKGAVVAVVDKFLTLISLIIFGLFGVWLFFEPAVALRISLFLILFVFILSFSLYSSKIRSLIKKYILRKYSSKFKGFSKGLFYLLKYKKKVLILNLSITILKSIFSAIIIFLLLLLFNVDINLLYVLIINSLVMLVSMIPITISGLGTKEASAVYFYSLLGAAPTNVFSAFLILRIITFLAATFFITVSPSRK